MSDTMGYRVLCEGVVVYEADTHEDASDMAGGWNHAYPAPPYPEFVIDRPCGDDDCPIGCDTADSGSSAASPSVTE
jgi:hypothetical protein